MFGAPILEGAGEVYGSVRYAAYALLPFIAILTAAYYQYRTLSEDGLSPMTVVRRLALCAILLVLYPYLVHTFVYLSTWISSSIFSRSQLLTVLMEIKTKSFNNMNQMAEDGLLSVFSLDYSAMFQTFAFVLCYGAHAIAEFMTKVIFSFLYVLGPLALAMGVIPGSPTLSGWFGSVLQVLCWPIAYSILYKLALTSGKIADIGGENPVEAFLASVTFAVAILFTPMFTRMLFNSSAASSAGSLGNLVSAKLGMDKLKQVGSAALRVGNTPIGSFGGGGSGGSDDRPGD